MNRDEALSALRDELAKYRQRSYAELELLIGQDLGCLEVTAPSGKQYQIEINVNRDSTGVRVDGGVDDGGWRAFLPLSEGFIMRPNGTILS